MSIKGDWMKATPATNKPTFTATVNAGIFLIWSKVDSCFGVGTRPDMIEGLSLFFRRNGVAGGRVQACRDIVIQNENTKRRWLF